MQQAAENLRQAEGALANFYLGRALTSRGEFDDALKAYDIIYAMTNGGPANRTQLLSTWMYFLTYNYNQVGLGTAIAVVLFSLTLIFAIPYIRFMTRKA